MLFLAKYIIIKNINRRIIFPAKYPNPYSVNLSKSVVKIFKILINSPIEKNTEI